MPRKPMSRFVPRGLAPSLAALLVTLALPARGAPITIPTVPVGNAGNAPGTLSTTNNPNNLVFGAVAYDYRIGTTEVTVGQYTQFLNAVAKTDTYGLYNTNLATDPDIAGIARSGSSGSYTYSVIGSPNKPVTYVSWGDAARFSNWLHHGQPSGLQGPGTTENGAYTLNGATTDSALGAVVRNPGAVWFIPSEDEWYKAAYHKNDGATGNYWTFATSSYDIPYSDQPPGSDAPTQSNTGNFWRNVPAHIGFNDGYAVTGSNSVSGNMLTDAGAYSDSVSSYGTYDQAGNVFEWNEALISGSSRGVRGGAWVSNTNDLAHGQRLYTSATSEFSHTGFRVATVPVPEPGTLVLGALGVIGLLLWGKRRK